MIKVTRKEFDFPTAKHFPSTPREELWEIHWERKFKSKVGLWWDMLWNSKDYENIVDLAISTPTLIVTELEEDKSDNRT